MIIDLEKKVNEIYSTPSDINEHIPIILNIGSQCEHITEMGVRWIVSTWAWLGCSPKTLISYDLYDPQHWNTSINDVKDTANYYGINFQFIKADVLKIQIAETDLLFIDTWHAYDQLKEELRLHSPMVKKYICFHDTTSYEFRDEPSHHENSWEGKTSGKGIWPAIQEFLNENKTEWKLKDRYFNNNGFTIIERHENNL